jgi:hypothetical protein
VGSGELLMVYYAKSRINGMIENVTTIAIYININKRGVFMIPLRTHNTLGYADKKKKW